MMRRVLGSDLVAALAILTVTYGAVALYAAVLWTILETLR